MVEIAIALAVIGFALVAIIGVLPLGMNVQRENREETIINQDASVFVDAIRSGARGLNDLTNYVMTITNYVWRTTATTNFSGFPATPADQVKWYTYASSSSGTGLRLTNGLRIVGLLSTPKFTTNYVLHVNEINQIVAHVRALSGAAAEKFPQTNSDLLNLAFAYRLIPEISPVPNVETNSFSANAYETNLHELKLAFRWPILPNGLLGNGRQIFRTQIGGSFAVTDENGLLITPTNNNNNAQRYYFLQPSTFGMPQ